MIWYQSVSREYDIYLRFQFDYTKTTYYKRPQDIKGMDRGILLDNGYCMCYICSRGAIG